jgi:hypothetical protein
LDEGEGVRIVKRRGMDKTSAVPVHTVVRSEGRHIAVVGRLDGEGEKRRQLFVCIFGTEELDLEELIGVQALAEWEIWDGHI